MTPLATIAIRSAFLTVLRRCAITRVVLPTKMQQNKQIAHIGSYTVHFVKSASMMNTVNICL